ncbi:hypothetical protein NP493_839g01106 [Ridgeia piscesae]|uniref:RING-type domain-containing protein n=1 Tax=Ridgeia piscesae TaxID=27915 RepID=A0AAD9NMM3_RIDPI|nr:hypothetical protein NP493_839g01106 [Ridgeia piscesae]
MRHKPNPMERRIRVRTLNPYITCLLCRGYLIEATTITECLHTFCKSCIVEYLEKNVTCPKCEIVIHQSHPRNYISHDRTMQDIVYKLVPHIQEIQLKRQQDFYKKRGLEMPRSLSVDEKLTNGNLASSPEKENGDRHRNDEQVNLCLECHNNQIKTLKRNYIRCSSLATISHLKKFLAFKLYNNIDKCKDVDILCNEEILGKDHTLKFISVTRWRIKVGVETGVT